MIYEKLKEAIFSDNQITTEEINTMRLQLFGDSLSMSELFVKILENEFIIHDAEPLSPNYETYAENYYLCLVVALENGLNPNEIIPHEEGETGGDNIMWAVISTIRRLAAAPKILKALLEYGGDPNLPIGIHETVYSETDFFFYLDGENLCENLLKCWLLLAAYGGDKDNADYLPLRMLNYHKQEELENYENYCFSFETPLPKIYKRTRVLFVIDKRTGEKVAVNETPFG